ncbi:cytochrome P450 [Lentinula aciculospora]|uniref:Cytochrome P450 n=1 Tax=Lentinula aciculospora TaxID=153920 RepID=A0A9W9ALS7_9AGAR|nr:cytochrome P450 [Lentinula aciculospora]
MRYSSNLNHLYTHTISTYIRMHFIEEFSSMSLTLIVSFVTLILYIWLRRNWQRFGWDSSKPLPPGPKKLPFFGNSFDMPSTHQWITFSKWADQFDSDILHLKVAGGDYIVLSSYKASTDLLDKRSGIYSSRPHVTMIQDLWDGDLLFLPYGESLHAHRKLFHQEFHPTNSSLHRPHEKKATIVFLNNLTDTPEEWLKHIEHLTGTTILAVAYGIHVQPKDDPNIAAVEKMISVFKAAAMPGAFLVDVFPILKYIPSWFPGASFKQKAKAWRGIFQETITPPFMHVKQAMASFHYYGYLTYSKYPRKKKPIQQVNGTAEDCFSLRCLQKVKNPDPRPDHLSEEEEIIKETVGTMYEGGADTGITALRTFLLAMMCFPETQQEAQEELDCVVGRERLPDYNDLDESLLPYVSAIVIECFRWQPIVPLAFPHQSVAEDTYKGYYIPKGSIVVPNVWRILQDEKMYGPNTDVFNPKRWLLPTSDIQQRGLGAVSRWKLNPDMPDPMLVSFGFGRRVCPGKHMGLSSFTMNVATLLYSFNITPPMGKDGILIKPEIKYVSVPLYLLNAPSNLVQKTMLQLSDRHY